jgi:hypothetical protein
VTHWTDELDEAFGDDAVEEPLVRPYTITRGRTAPDRDDLTLITVVTAVVPDGSPDPRGLQPEHRAVLDLCREPKAVAEIAAGLDLPVSVTKILIGDLIGSGRVRARPPLSFEPESGPIDMTILEAVRDGLRKL